MPAYYALGVPSRFSFDLDFHALIIQGLLETGSYQTHNRVGAPFGLELYDFPQGSENVQWLIMRALAVVADTPGAVMNSYLVLTFPLIAAVAFGAFRALGASRPAALVVGVLYTVLPYHFLRGQYHLLLANYMAVPLGCLLVVGVLRGDAVFGRNEGRPQLIRRWLTARTVGVLAICAVIGATGSYYAALTLLLLGLGGLTATLVHRRKAPVVTAALLCVAILSSMFVNLAPTLAYWHENGRNPVAAVRAPGDAETFSLKFTQLVLPSAQHRVTKLGGLSGRYLDTQALTDEGTASLGFVGALGFLWLLGIVLAATGGRRLRVANADTHRAAALGAVLAFAVGTTGGLSALVSWYVTPQIRAYNRLSVYIAFFALLAVALLLDSGARRLRANRARGPLLAVGAFAVLVVGVLDQTSPKVTPDYRKAQERWAGLEDFGRQAEALLPPGAKVFQLPIIPFPEFYPPAVGPYEEAQGALHTRTLRWSFAAMKGRPAYEWQAKLVPLPVAETIRGVTAAGFSALYLDRKGFDPAVVPALERDIIRTLRSGPAVVGSNGRLELFDLRDYAKRLRAKMGASEYASLGRSTLQAPPPLPQLDG